MLLQCSNCAGSVTANDGAIRRGVVLCDYCHTALRITKSSVEIYKKQFLECNPPDGIKVERGAKGAKLFAPVKYIEGGIISRREARALWKGVLVLGLLSVVSFGLFCFPAFFILFIWMFTFSDTHMLLQDGMLEVPLPPNYETPVADIQQLYVTVNQVVWEEGSRTLYNLFALKKDGTRAFLHGSFISLEAALYAEEWLEIELGIFNLPVYGDSQTRSLDVVIRSTQSDEQTICYACTAPLPVTTAVRQKGYLTCVYCRTITLLYTTQDSHKLILGRPNPEKMIYRVRTRGQFAGVLQKKDKQVVLLLSENKIKEVPFNNILTGKEVERFGIQEILVPSPLSLGDWFSGKRLARFEQVVAYSRSTIKQDYLNNIAQYTVRGQIGGKQYPIIPNMEDLHEAAFVVETLNNFLESHL